MKKNLFKIIQWLIAFLLIYLVFHLAGFEKTVNSLKESKKELIAIAALGALGINILRWWRWHSLLEDMAICPKNQGKKQTLKAYCIGLFIGSLTPGTLGEVSRAAFLKQSKTAAAAGILMEKLFDLLISLWLCFFGIGWLFGIWAGFIWFILTALPIYLMIWGKSDWALAIGRFSYKISLDFILAITKNPAKRDKYLEKMDELGNRIYLGWSTISKGGKFGLFIRTTSMYAINYSVIQLLLIAFGGPLRIEVFYLIPIIYLMKLVPISPSGLGAKEAAAIYFFNMIGIEGSASVNATLMTFFLNFIIPSIAGIILLLTRNLGTITDKQTDRP